MKNKEKGLSLLETLISISMLFVVFGSLILLLQSHVKLHKFDTGNKQSALNLNTFFSDIFNKAFYDSILHVGSKLYNVEMPKYNREIRLDVSDEFNLKFEYNKSDKTNAVSFISGTILGYKNSNQLSLSINYNLNIKRLKIQYANFEQEFFVDSDKDFDLYIKKNGNGYIIQVIPEGLPIEEYQFMNDNKLFDKITYWETYFGNNRHIHSKFSIYAKSNPFKIVDRNHIGHFRFPGLPTFDFNFLVEENKVYILSYEQGMKVFRPSDLYALKARKVYDNSFLYVFGYDFLEGAIVKTNFTNDTLQVFASNINHPLFRTGNIISISNISSDMNYLFFPVSLYVINCEENRIQRLIDIQNYNPVYETISESNERCKIEYNENDLDLKIYYDNTYFFTNLKSNGRSFLY
ncbi:MAG: hypothetical protein N2505_00075 [Endomicrobia bacterium]|nr:hypothetical protein [Endomicrobiia bacterium]